MPPTYADVDLDTIESELEHSNVAKRIITLGDAEEEQIVAHYDQHGDAHGDTP